MFSTNGVTILCFADNAFKELGTKKSVDRDLFSLEISHLRDSLAIQWKPGCLETPNFCRQVNDIIYNSTPWSFMDFNYCIKWLGFLSGYPQTLTTYLLHRGAENAIDCMLLSARAERYRLLNLVSRPTGHISPAEPDNGPCTGMGWCFPPSLYAWGTITSSVAESHMRPFMMLFAVV